MESVGARIRGARESRGYTIEQIARDTHIAKRFLEAIEAEAYDVIPGEPYLLGFLRTYSSYLGLDPEETIALYHNTQLQEQPPPIDELISSKPRLPVTRVLLIALIVGALAAGVYFVLGSDVLGSGDAADSLTDSSEPLPIAGTRFDMDGEIIEQVFQLGDQVLVPVQGEQIPVAIHEIGDALRLEYQDRLSVVPIGQEVSLDLNADERSDLRVLVRSLDPSSDPPSVIMRWDRGLGGAGAVAGADPGDRVAATPVVGSTSEPSRQESARVLAEFTVPEEFLIEVRFEGYTLFRYEVDEEPRVEQYFQEGENLRVSVADQFKLWASNAASVRMRIAGRDVTLGESGEVTSALITWGSDATAAGAPLELVPVY